MECKAMTDTITICEALLDTGVELPVDAEFTLPDYCPDIGKLLQCRATAGSITKDIDGNTVRLEGTAKLLAIYLDGRDKNVRCCEHEVPISATLPVQKLPEGAIISVKPKLDYINCRAISQRKLDVHGAFTARVCITAPKQVELMTGAQGAGVRTRTNPVMVSEFVGRTQSNFTISEALELSAGKPPVNSIVRCSASVISQDCKPIANKLIVKGELSLNVVYCTDAGGLDNMQYILPFNQFIDLPGVEDSCSTELQISIVSAEVRPKADSDGEYRRLSADIQTCAEVKAGRLKELTPITDAYSVDYELSMEKKHHLMERTFAETDCRLTADCRLNVQKELSEVLDCWCDIASTSTEHNGDNLTVKVTGTCSAVVRMSDGDADYMEAPFTGECNVPVPDGSTDCGAHVRLSVRSCGYTISSGHIDVRAQMEGGAVPCQELHVVGVSSIVPDESRPKHNSEQPPVIMYFGEAGEELWDVAHTYNTCVEDIMNDNELSGERLNENCLLLIAVR